MDFVDGEKLKADAGSHDVDDRIHRTDLVEVDRLQRDPVNTSFCFTQGRENVSRSLAYPIGEIGSLD